MDLVEDLPTCSGFLARGFMKLGFLPFGDPLALSRLILGLPPLISCRRLLEAGRRWQQVLSWALYRCVGPAKISCYCTIHPQNTTASTIKFVHFSYLWNAENGFILCTKRMKNAMRAPRQSRHGLSRQSALSQGHRFGEVAWEQSFAVARP